MPSCKSPISAFYLGNFQKKVLIINILLRLRMSANAYTYTLVKPATAMKTLTLPNRRFNEHPIRRMFSEMNFTSVHLHRSCEESLKVTLSKFSDTQFCIAPPVTERKPLPLAYLLECWLPPFSLIRDFGKQNTRGNVSKISVSLACYRQIGSKSTNHSPLAWRKEGRKVTLVAVIGGFRSDLSITRKTDGNFGNVSAGILFSKVVYQRKCW